LALAAHCRKFNYSADLEKLAREARTLIAEDDWLNLARLESISGNLDASIDCLLRASEQEDFDPVQALQDPYLEWVRNDVRFKEIVVVPTDNESDEGTQKESDG
jgi:hypothetical protein